MKKYNIDNYNRYKKDVLRSQPKEGKMWDEYTRDELIVKFLPLVENLSRKFSTRQEASGVLDITDLIQYGSIGLISAVDNLKWDILNESDDIEKTLKVFLSKSIKGAVRRAININRGDIKIPEYQLNELRGLDTDEADNYDPKVMMFFNSVFDSIDELDYDGDNPMHMLADERPVYNIDMLNTYLLTLMATHLTHQEYEVLRLTYGLDCEKQSYKEIAIHLGFEMKTYVNRISQIKRDGINKLIREVKPNQIFDIFN